MKYLLYISIFILILFNVFKLGKNSVKPSIIEKVDTITITDTITIYNPDKDTVYLTKYVKDTLYLSDSTKAEVNIPISTTIYKDSTYEASISGYKTSLDWIKVYQPTKTITKEKTIYKSNKKVNVSLSSGYGYGVIHKQSDFFVGFTVSVPLFDF